MLRGDALRDKVILVTGGGSGLGLAMARRCAELGARVAIAGRSAERLEAAAPEIDPTGERIFTHAANVREYDEVEALVAAVTERFGQVDALVNNAAGNFLAATEELTPGGFRAVVDTVLNGTFHATLACGRRWIEAGRAGNILNIVTTYAWTGSAFVVPSAAAKAGVLAMTRSLAAEWGAYGIRVNAIAPGPFPTEGAFSRLIPTPELEERMRARIPLGRFGDPAELAELAAFLLSDAVPFLTGECVTIDGGEWLAAGGQFNALLQVPREELKETMRGLRPERKPAR
jgi:NAD(P)-dependent dehydrogenase (short-subunit alcohol dehydrogenase family)